MRIPQKAIDPCNLPLYEVVLCFSYPVVVCFISDSRISYLEICEVEHLKEKRLSGGKWNYFG